jgi:tetratricopeptide (TPR) repeat protein
VADTPETNFRLAQFLQRAARINDAQAVLQHVDRLNRSALTAADLSFSLGKAGSALEAYVRTLHAPDGSAVKDEAAIISRAVEAALYSRERGAAERTWNARQLMEQNAGALDEGTRAVLETEIALVAGDLDLAASSSRRALEYLPRSAAAHYLRGVVFDLQGDENAAEVAWKDAIEADDHIPSHMSLAQVAVHRGSLDQAQEHIATVVREEPANLQALLIYARVLEREQNLDGAQAIVNRALIIDPASVEANVIAGNIAMQRKASGTAFIAYEKALLFDGRSAEGITGLLNVFSQGRPTRSSIAKIERMAAAPPESAMLYEVAGRLYELAGFKSEARRALRRSLDLDAHRPTARLALWKAGERDRATVLDDVQDPTVRDYEHALANGDQTGIAANNLAFAYAARGMRLDRAFELSLDAVRRMPAKAEPMDTLGFVFLKMRQYTAAADAFERALQLSPHASVKRQILLHLADAYAASGEDTKAASARAAAGRLRG